MLTPAEVVGLSGATLETRVRQATRHVTDAAFASISKRLLEGAREHEVMYERDGALEAVRIMLRPLLVMPEQLSYVHHVCARITDALKRLPMMYVNDPGVRSVMLLSDDEQSWLRGALGPKHASGIYARLDAVCNFSNAGWRESLQFMESNLSGVGGIHYGPLAEALVMREVVPTLQAHDPDLEIERPRDQRDLFLQVLLDHAEAIGVRKPNLCFIEPKYDGGGPNEQPSLIRHLRGKYDRPIVHADPRELRLVGDDVFFEDTRIDIAYRDYEARDLIALEKREGIVLEGVRALFQHNRVVSSIGGDLDHKSSFELLTDPDLAQRHFTTEERRLFDRHVLWTRVLSERACSLPRGHGDLPEFVHSHREELVIKPNRGYGGTDAFIGRLIEQGEWDALIDRALTTADDSQRSWVVQSVTNLPVYEFPVVDDGGRVHEEPFYVVMGFAPTDGGLGVLCRASQKQVVNVAQRGGLGAVLIGFAPTELRAPVRSTARRHEAVDKLRSQIADLRGLDAAIGLLGWDEETYLPEGARAGRGEQLGTLESMRHRLLTSDALGDLVEEVAAHSDTNELLAAELMRLRRLRRTELALPNDLVRAFAQARSNALSRWEQARKSDSFGVFAPAFVRMLGLVRERAQALQRTDRLYDGLLDEHEPGMTQERIGPLLEALRERLTPLAEELEERTARVSDRLPAGRYPDAAQERFCRTVLTDIGFDFERGRLDRSTHPFTLAAGENDVRVTMRAIEDNPLTSIFAALHEGGHGLYDQGFDPVLFGTLLAEAPSTGIHESQSRLWENHIGRSRAFWEHYLPQLRELFPEQLINVDAERAYRTVNTVRRGWNRVEADEVTYNLHVVLRYELETQLLDGHLRVEELEVAWAEASERLLGTKPTSAREGCLQDVHWSLGAFGYFPTYAIGNLFGAQLMEAFLKAHPGFEADLAKGASADLLLWLRRNVHAHGWRHGAEEILEQATGRPLDIEPFFRLLNAKHAQ